MLIYFLSYFYKAKEKRQHTEAGRNVGIFISITGGAARQCTRHYNRYLAPKILLIILLFIILRAVFPRGAGHGISFFCAVIVLSSGSVIDKYGK